MNTRIYAAIVTMITMITFIGAGESYAATNADHNSLNNSLDLNVIVSGTMEPTLYLGDIVVVYKNPDDIQVGDIVIYKATWFPEPVIHRVISIKHDSNGSVLYEMKGDHNPVPDPTLVSPKQIISKVVKINDNYLIIPKLGYITIWFRGL